MDEEIYIAKKEETIVSYAYGQYDIIERNSSYNTAVESAFYLEEIYVHPRYRFQGIGKSFYEYIEEEVQSKAQVLKVIAACDHYECLLRFYVQELGMSFNHALLVKWIQ